MRAIVNANVVMCDYVIPNGAILFDSVYVAACTKNIGR